MRDIFFGYYRPTDEEFAELWDNCLFVLDANVLLDLYRYSPQSSERLIDILTRVSDRLWIPHQVALEYQNNRPGAIGSSVKLYDDISNRLQKTKDELERLLKQREEHLSLDVDRLLGKIEGAFAQIEEELDVYREQHPDLFQEDHIRETLTALFAEKVGQPYSQERLAEIYEVGAERYASKVPPGYEDVGEKEGQVTRYGSLIIQSMYGDLILWFQIIDRAKSEQRPIVLVTGDAKEDWWWQVRGRTIGPRPELATEMMGEASVSFYMYTPDRFMHYAGEYLGVQVEREVIDEIQSVAEERTWKDEVRNALEALGGEAHLSEIYDHIEDTTSRKLAETWRATVRRTLQRYSSDTETFRGDEDLFCRLDRGYWGLREDQEQQESAESQRPRPTPRRRGRMRRIQQRPSDEEPLSSQ
jgi:hypothetical protein